MAQQDNTGTKDQKPTSRKLRDARKKGQVPQSKELTAAAGLLAGCVVVAFLLKGFMGSFNELYELIMRFGDGQRIGDVSGMVMLSLSILVKYSLVVFLVTAIAIVLVGRIQAGAVFSFEPVKAKLERINPTTNLKNMFSAKAIMMLALMLGKTLLLTIGVWMVFQSYLGDAVRMVLGGAGAALTVFGGATTSLVMWCVIAFIALAMFDLVFQRFQFTREMRMSIQDIKRERREDEGDPIIKSARRNASREANNVDQMQYVDRASIAIYDDTGRAIALAYLPDQFERPIVIIRAAGGLAQTALSIAQNSGVPLVPQRELMDRLWPMCRSSATVPEEFSKELTELIAYHRDER